MLTSALTYRAGTAPTAASSQPAVQSSAPKIGFHRRLQETTLARALALRGQVEKLDTEWSELVCLGSPHVQVVVV